MCENILTYPLLNLLNTLKEDNDVNGITETYSWIIS
jgi:hypothetical protein